MLPPEHFHTTPISGDAIAALTSAEIKRYGPKLPQLHLRFDDSVAFMETYKFIAEQILIGHNTQSEKNKEKALLDTIMCQFFKFDVNSVTLDNSEDPSELDIKIFMNDNYLKNRLELSEKNFTDSWGEISKIISQEIQNSDDKHENKKVKVARPPKGTRGGHNKKADKKDVPIRPLDIIDRGLANDGHNGPAMLFFISDDIVKDDKIFLPSASDFNSVMYATVNFYSFFRHFHCLYERLIKARVLADKGLEEELERKPELKVKYDSLTEEKKAELKAERYEQMYVKGLNSLLNGNIDTARYEEFCQHCLGKQAYLLFSIDKLINSVLNYNRLGTKNYSRETY